MIAYLQGTIIQKQPTHLILENNGIGYFIKISLHTFETIPADTKLIKLYTYLQVKEDGFTLYGFYTQEEKNLFELLISVSGVGGNTATAILSGLNPIELQKVIAGGDILKLKKVKGIGEKTAARIILELKDKAASLSPETGFDSVNISSNIRSEALSALMMLGFPKVQMEKRLDELLKTQPNLSLEELIKSALRA